MGGHFFFDPQKGNQFGESIGNFIIAQSVKHVSGTLLYFAANDQAHLPLWSAGGIAVRCSALLSVL
jgi:hypothetical protein